LTVRHKRAGLIITGKTNTPEHGILPTTEPHLFGPSRNPWDTTRIPAVQAAAQPLRSLPD